MAEFAPRDEADLVELAGAAAANRTPLEIVGGGGKRPLGHPVAADHVVAATALSGITLYEPSELVMTAGAGTTVGEVRRLLRQNGQELAFDPPDLNAVLGEGDAEAATIGAVFAVGAAGPRRIRIGSARDHLLGFRAVSGRAEPFKSGGRVMKNVTGYDLSKLVTGSYGTLGVLSEVTFKTLPRAETEATLILHGRDDREAVRLMTEASGLPHEVSSLAHIDRRTALRVEGPEVSVRERLAALERHFGGECERLAETASRALWEEVRDVVPLSHSGEQLWRLSVAPSEGAAAIERFRAAGLPLEGHFYDWAGGLVWLALGAGDHAAALRNGLDGHAMLVRAPEAVRASTPVFHPQPPALAALSRRVKESFDPERILNPGRMGPDP